MDTYPYAMLVMQLHKLLSPADYSRPDTSFVFSDAQHSPVSAMLFSRLPSSPLQTTLRKFPCEIRVMIYNLVLSGSWDGITHSFIAALRPDHLLYEEALQVFYRTNTFSLTKKNEWLRQFVWKDEPKSRVVDSEIKYMCETLQSVYVRVPLEGTSNIGSSLGGLSTVPSFDRCVLILSLAKNVTHLHISVVPNTRHINQEWFTLFSHLMHSLSRLVKLSITWQRETIEMSGGWLSPFITELSHNLRLGARLERVQTDGDCTWVWNANTGDTVRYIEPVSSLSSIMAMAGELGYPPPIRP